MKCENGPTQPNLSKCDSKRYMQETTLYSESKYKLIITNEKLKRIHYNSLDILSLWFILSFSGLTFIYKKSNKDIIVRFDNQFNNVDL